MNKAAFHVAGHQQTSEPTPYRLVFDEAGVKDIVDVTGKTPFDDLLEKEDLDRLSGESFEVREIQTETVSRLLSFLFKKKHEKLPDPTEVALRCFTLAYSVSPSLIDAMSMSEIAALFKRTGAMFSKRVAAQDTALNIRARTRKPVGSIEKYREATTRHHAKKAA